MISTPYEWILWLVAVSIVFVAGCTAIETQEKPDGATTAPQTEPQSEKPAPKPVSEEKGVEYEIHPGERGDKEVGFAGVKRYVRDIVVARETADEEIKATLSSALDDYKSKHPDADALHVRVFFKGSTAVAYGHGYWAPGGEWSQASAGGAKSVSIELNRALRPPPLEEGERFGFSLDTRKEIYAALAGVQDKAWDEAEARYPYDVDKESELVDQLAPKYRREVCKEYDLRPSEEEAIAIEGAEQYWEW